MKRIAQVIALAAALGAFPAFAGDPAPGSERDPFSQTYIGRDPEEIRAERERDVRAEVERVVRAERERERAQASPCDRSCPCGHKRVAQQ